jgi:MFS family permease
MEQGFFNLKRFVASRFLGALSDQFLLFAVPLAVIKSTGSVKYSAVAFIIEWLPRVGFFPLGGFFADRIKPRHIFFGVELGRAITVMIAAGIMAANIAGPFWTLSLMMALLSVGYVLNFVGTEAFLPRHLEVSELTKAHSLLQGVDQITQVVGPAIAVLISVYAGLNTLLFFGAGLFAASALNLFSLKSKPVEQSQKFSMAVLLESHQVALSVLMENKVLFHLCALTWVVNLVYGTALVVSAAIVVKTFMLPESYFGALQTVAAIASITAFGFVPRFAARFGLPALGTISFTAMIFSGLLLALSGNYYIYLVGYAILMVFDGAFNVYIRTLRSQIIPRAHLGKTTGLIALLNMCSIPMSALAVTLLSSHFSPIGILGMIFLLALILGVALVVFGKHHFKYHTWLPSLPALEKAAT